MNAEVIIEKYTQALFDAATAAGNLNTVVTELDSVSKIIAEKSTLAFFTSPFNSADQKIMAAKSSLEGKVSAELFNFIATLVKNERTQLVVQINDLLKMKASQVGGEAEGDLFVVQEPSAEFKATLEKKVSGILKKEVRLTVKKDPALISGFKVQVEGWTLDDSALNHLKKLTENISTRGL